MSTLPSMTLNGAQWVRCMCKIVGDYLGTTSGLQGFCIEYDQKQLAGSGATHRVCPNMVMVVALGTTICLCWLDAATCILCFVGLTWALAISKAYQHAHMHVFILS